MASRGDQLVRVGIKWCKHFCLEKRVWAHLSQWELLIQQCLQMTAFTAQDWSRSRISDSVGLITLSLLSRKEQLQFQNRSTVTHLINSKDLLSIAVKVTGRSV